jgi:peroxiredoxin family protein
MGTGAPALHVAKGWQASRSSLEARVERLERERPHARPGLSIVVASGDLDRLMAALVLANGAATMGQPVDMFFSFWATAALVRDPPRRGRGWFARLLGWVLPRGTRGLALSRLHLGGLGTALLSRRMKTIGIPTCAELLAMAREAGVRISVCEMTMSLMGLSLEDLVDYPGLRLCGAVTFLESAEKSTALFV